MANRRFGEMDGPQGGNGAFYQDQLVQINTMHCSVNSWQPNVSSNNFMNQGSQLTSNFQQLASALISSLQPQQQQMNNPPSLLSLNTFPAFSNQDRDLNRFGNGRDLRRHKPYSKDVEEQNKSDPQSRAGKYYDIPVNFFNCFVCNEEMWDGDSMENHIQGRNHKQMLNNLEKSFQIIVSILREKIRFIEIKKVSKLNHMQHKKNTNFYERRQAESVCVMCDYKFLGRIITHRKTEDHQRLKRYLHPTCNICNKEFRSRIEWVEHRLTPEHLKLLKTTLEKKIGGIGGEVLVQPEEEIKLDKLLKEQLLLENENPILELTDDMTGLQNLVPLYKKTRSVSIKSLVSFEGFMCKLCNIYFEKQELTQAHLKSRTHYDAFIKAAKAKYQRHGEELRKKAKHEQGRH